MLCRDCPDTDLQLVAAAPALGPQMEADPPLRGLDHLELPYRGTGGGRPATAVPGGELLGVASQIASMVGFDPSGFGSPT